MNNDLELPKSLICFMDFFHHLLKWLLNLLCLQINLVMREMKVINLIFLFSHFRYNLSTPFLFFEEEEEEDEHDTLTDHTHGRYARSLGRFPHLFTICLSTRLMSFLPKIPLVLIFSYQWRHSQPSRRHVKFAQR